MTITLDSQSSLALAEEFAKQIHGAVVSMHLRVVWGLYPGEAGQPNLWANDFLAKDGIARVRRAIQSIKDPMERRQFIGEVRWYFKDLRQKQGTGPRWQDYYASVKAHCEKTYGGQS